MSAWDWLVSFERSPAAEIAYEWFWLFLARWSAKISLLKRSFCVANRPQKEVIRVITLWLWALWQILLLLLMDGWRLSGKSMVVASHLRSPVVACQEVLCIYVNKLSLNTQEVSLEGGGAATSIYRLLIVDRWTAAQWMSVEIQERPTIYCWIACAGLIKQIKVIAQLNINTRESGGGGGVCSTTLLLLLLLRDGWWWES